MIIIIGIRPGIGKEGVIKVRHRVIHVIPTKHVTIRFEAADLWSAQTSHNFYFAVEYFSSPNIGTVLYIKPQRADGYAKDPNRCTTPPLHHQQQQHSLHSPHCLPAGPVIAVSGLSSLTLMGGGVVEVQVEERERDSTCVCADVMRSPRTYCPSIHPPTSQPPPPPPPTANATTAVALVGETSSAVSTAPPAVLP